MKLVGRLSAAAMILFLAGCGGDAGNEPAGPVTEAERISPPHEDGSTAVESPLDSPSTAPTHATPGAATTAASAPVQPPVAYLQCRSCHSVEKGQHGIGPLLHGILGIPAASQPGFVYSPALKASGIVWNRSSLDTWLSSPMKMVPGTRMVIGVANAEARKDIIDYLETLK